MPFRNILKPSDVQMLTEVLDQHCASNGIRSEEGKLSAAASLVRFYQRGFTDPVMLAKLIDREDDPDRTK